MINNLSYSLVDTTLKVHWVCTCCNILQAFSNNCLCEDSSSCCTVTSIITSLACNTLNKLCTSILKVILKLYLLSNGNTVLSNLWSTKLLTDNNITPLRTECYLHCICQLINTTLQEFTCV